MRPLERPGLPFQCFQGVYDDVSIELLLTGSGRSRAAIAVSGWLSQELASRPGTGLLAPPLTVANFGTAGAYHGDWSVGQTLLAFRLRNGLSGESIYPERFVSWPHQETECRTVDTPMREVAAKESVRPLFDMEAFGVAQAVTSYLSSSHLVVGKCVLDTIGPEGDQDLDFVALRQRCETAYREGAQHFLEHTLEHQRFLDRDLRRQRSTEIASLTEEFVAQTQPSLGLTVSQSRELAQELRGRLSAESDLAAFAIAWQSRPTPPATLDKRNRQLALTELLDWLRGEPAILSTKASH